ncbi:MAG: pyroglutamyl-peptidase I [Anaerococcus sp.]|uniref:Pyrrolidone-carboxylate peptidase n=1 Tax=Anaerococcus nagyae TaxID=1755241 RepID=A0A3E2TL73_9FIRM|nr:MULTISPECIES: pyroglutamyl-peptidase I [Anaerococcus]MDU2353599.1 pyroglutamyl-peptidase I [Anaerococcus sp.]RGB77264.1 pyroglutamyl-peptidase I [Anaerococcus nagyae]
MKILVTGFDPFEGEPTNPAIESVKRIDNEIEGAEIIKLEIPTVFQKSADVVEAKIREINPDVVLSVGQAGGRYGITVERVAINQDDARIEDNEGNQPIDTAIREDGAPAYFATLPIKAMVEEIKKENIPASVSNTAGTFVCNHIMYQDLYLAEKYGNIRAGFIHVPYLTEQVVDKKDTASMSLEDIVRGLNAAIRAIVKYSDKEDLNVTGGATH